MRCDKKRPSQIQKLIYFTAKDMTGSQRQESIGLALHALGWELGYPKQLFFLCASSSTDTLFSSSHWQACQISTGSLRVLCFASYLRKLATPLIGSKSKLPYRTSLGFNRKVLWVYHPVPETNCSKINCSYARHVGNTRNRQHLRVLPGLGNLCHDQLA